MLFPDTYPDLLTTDDTMAEALTEAAAQTATQFPSVAVNSTAAVSVAAVENSDDSDPPTFAYAGLRDTAMYFSASLLKVSAMLAAFELRQSAGEIAANEASCDAATVFSDLQNQFDQDIENSVPLLLNTPGITHAMRVPTYSAVFAAPQSAPNGGCQLTFGTTFATNMRGMIVDSNNNQAAATIQALGYSWINGLVSNGGLFDQSANTGIWLAGTFLGTMPAVRIPSVNDGPSAQATTTIDMTRFLALLIEADTLDERSDEGISAEMLTLLSDAQSVGDSSWMTTDARPGYTGIGDGFTITHCKIGLGNLKAGPEIASEATILRHDDSDTQFLVVWQNVANTAAAQNAMSFLVRTAILNYLST
ncbi:hypothetical protein [Mycobacterium sp.]|uniref:hypothetical protein n=1 Tax=Mycobacterium sp. TaxID=1785 RepID=UPI003F97C8F2